MDLVNNLDRLAEDKQHVLMRVKEKANTCDKPRLERAAREYGTVRAKKFFSSTAADNAAQHVA